MAVQETGRVVVSLDESQLKVAYIAHIIAEKISFGLTYDPLLSTLQELVFEEKSMRTDDEYDESGDADHAFHAAQVLLGLVQ